MRALLLIVAVLLAFSPKPALARTPFDGVWLFEHAPDYPGVTMMEVTSKDGQVSGHVATQWYGPIPMQNARLIGGELQFEIRNLNDKERATRIWTSAVQSDGTVKLSGDIWYAHVEQTGIRGTQADKKRRSFRFAELPVGGTIDWDGLAKAPPMGWSSWNKFEDKIDDKTIREIADAMVATGLRDAGYVYVNIDDGWQGVRGPDGEMRPNDRFPDMKALADYLHDRGLKLGIYTSPGPRSCAGYEGSYGHIEQDARTFARWGVDYVKYDLCSGEWFYDDAEKVRLAYYAFGAALKATGRPIIYSLCEYGRFDVGSWGRSVGGQLWRVSGDITDDFQAMARIGFEKRGNPEVSGPGGWNDLDMLEIGNGGMSEDEYRTHMTLWAISAAPLIMGHDVRKSDPATLRLLTNREVIAVDQDPKGVQGKLVRRVDAAEVWTKPLADGSVAIALFNRSGVPATMNLQASDAGFGSLTTVRDLWRGAELSPGGGTFVVPPHGTILLKVGGQ
jgi:alpha-galactosidase